MFSAFGRALLFDYGAPILGRSAKIGAQNISKYHAAAGERPGYAGHRVSLVIEAKLYSTMRAAHSYSAAYSRAEAAQE